MNPSTVTKRLAIAASAVVIASLIGAAFVLESPMTQRQRRLDERRLRDIQSIVRSVQSYAEKHNALPKDIAVLEEETEMRRPPADPVTNMPYEYKTLNESSFELCAVFSLSSSYESGRYYGDGYRAHAAGKQCFKYNKPASRNKE
ncbi:MAG: hypothetical protein LBG78_04840 [Azoarcus sp.]|jgi:hypothetical protein|nr:hypothetical protein [Azoarcus sp.]